ncbi:MAG: hypothetical protein GX258_04105 [Clostridiales bacterium]|nr:hypothetical protein [Clostridiales bacterium]
MRDIRVVLELEKVIPLSVKEGEDPELKASKIIDKMIEKDKKNDSYLSSFEIYKREFEWIEEESLIFILVKKAIDSFDPYFVHPDSYDEYDGESGRIAEKIKKGMSINQIAEIMKEEFIFSFSAKFTKEDFFHTAETVFNLLKNSLKEPHGNGRNTNKKEYVYVKLTLCKVIPVKILEKEDGRLEDGRAKAIKIVFDKIESDRKSGSVLSSFNISVGWGTKDMSKEALFHEMAFSSIRLSKYSSDFSDELYDKCDEEAEKIMRKYKEGMTVDEIASLIVSDLKDISSEESKKIAQDMWNAIEDIN